MHQLTANRYRPRRLSRVPHTTLPARPALKRSAWLSWRSAARSSASGTTLASQAIWSFSLPDTTCRVGGG